MNAVEFHRAAVAFHAAELARLEGSPASSGFDQNRIETWWPAMLEQFKNDGLPHAWRDWTAGTPPDQVGDGDKPDDDFLRQFGPFMDAMTRVGFKDSTGERFFVPNIKRRTGLGWEGVKDECRRAWNSPEGIAWRADPLNLPLLPKSAP